MDAEKFTSIIPLYDYQRRFIRDRSRLKGWVKSRQIGGSFGVSLDVVLDAIETAQDWNMMSRSQRQAEKLLAKVATHVIAANTFTENITGESIVHPRDIGSRRIKLRNGATLEALPCDPDTTTGDTCNWFIDEFALFPKSDEVFGVIKPSIMHGKKMVVVSSPRGRQHKFYDLYNTWQRMSHESGWSWHVTNIEQATQGGLKLYDHNGKRLSYKQFREQEIRDIGPEMYAQEYMCSFSDDLVALLAWDAICNAQTHDLRMVRTNQQLVAIGKSLYIGIDVGRRRDLTVIWVLYRNGDAYETASIYVLDRCPFKDQERLIRSILQTRAVKGCHIDEQGIGMALAEALVDDFPGIVTPVSPTNANKAEMAMRLKVALDNGEFLMPYDDDTVEDFASIQKSITGAGNIQISAPRSATGHGDRFWAAALAVRAAAKLDEFKVVMATAG